MEMHAGLRRLQQQRKLGLVVVDYLQLMSGRGRFENRNQEISTISRGMKLLSKELNVPMLVLSQLSRAPETRQGDHRPQLSDLRESGSIEQDADLVAFIFREEVYKRDREDLRGMAELIVAKQRNGPIGKVDLVSATARIPGWFVIPAQTPQVPLNDVMPVLIKVLVRTIAMQDVFSTRACGFSTVRAPTGSAKRMKYHKKNVEEITFKRQNFI